MHDDNELVVNKHKSYVLLDDKFLRFLIYQVFFDIRQKICRVPKKSARQKNYLLIKYLPSVKRSLLNCLQCSVKNGSLVVCIVWEL